MPIKILPDQLVNKIAAGEVVERPASVVKELLENSIDAKAAKIEIDLIGGGIEQIKITDDGRGMSGEDAAVAFLRHSTSKISAEADLWNINTLGFRGEALASIAAVADIELTSRSQADDAGIRVNIGSNQPQSLEPTGAPVGTSITVSKLFATLPVRRKYMKTVRTEHNHCVSVVTDYALAYPQVSFKLTSNGKVILDVTPTKDWQTRIREVLGKKDSDQMIPISGELNQYRVEGFLGKPGIARKSRKHQYIYVNHRRIDDYLIGYRIKEGFHTLLAKELHPVFVLNLHLPPQNVDVNIHPRKAQVKFQEPNLIYQMVEQAAISALQGQDLIPSAPIDSEEPAGDMASWPGGQSSTFFSQPAPTSTAQTRTPQSGFSDIHTTGVQPTIPQVQAWATHSAPMLQIYQTYILGQDEQGIFIIDQHAAQERITYETLLNNLKNGVKQAQPLLMPNTIELSTLDSELLESNLKLLSRLDIEVESFGPQAWTIRAVPIQLSESNIEELIRNLLDELVEDKKAKSSDQAIEEKLIMRACKSSIKAHDKLQPEQMQHLMEQLFKCEQSHTCPHGRPTVVRLEEQQLEKWFKRTGF